MNARPSPTIVIRRTFGIYAEQAGFLLPAGLAMGLLVALDGVPGRVPLALGLARLLISVMGLTLFASTVVLLVSDVHAGGERRSLGELLSSSGGSMWQVFLTGAVAAFTLALVDLFATTVSFGLLIGNVFSRRPWQFGLALLVISLGLFAELFLTTAWFVAPAVAILERPGRARALRLSRKLVRENGWRVLAVTLAFLVPLTLLVDGVGRLTGDLHGAPLFAVEMLLTTAVAPIPMVAMALLYFELRRCSGPDLTPPDDTPALGPPLPA
jgi:hypothetical protein